METYHHPDRRRLTAPPAPPALVYVVDRNLLVTVKVSRHREDEPLEGRA